MGRGKGIALLLAVLGLIAVLVWLLGANDSGHAGKRASTEDHRSNASGTKRSENTPSSSPQSSTVIDGQDNSTGGSPPPEEREIAILCTIDGVPGLPQHFQLAGPRLLERTDDPAAGTIRGRMLHEAGSIEFTILAAGIVADGARVQAPEGQPFLIRLRRRIPLRLQIEGRVDIAMYVDLQRYEEPHGWRTAEGGTTIGDETDTEFGSMRPFEVGMGRYRVILPGPIVLHEFEVPRGSGPMEMRVDLRRAEWLTFELTGPEGIKLDGRRCVVVSGPGVVWPRGRLRSRRFIHPGDRALRFEVDAPKLAPHPTRGSAIRREGGTLQLEAIAAATITFDWPGDVVHGHAVFRLRADGRPKLMSARLHYQTYRFWDAPGTHDYIVHASGYAPVVMRGVRVGAPLHEMGMLPAVAGQTVRIQLEKLREFDVVTCSAHWLDHDLPLWRRVAHRDQPEAEFRGMPAGKIRFTFTARGKTWTHDHVSNAEGILRLPVKLPRG